MTRKGGPGRPKNGVSNEIMVPVMAKHFPDCFTLNTSNNLFDIKRDENGKASFPSKAKEVEYNNARREMKKLAKVHKAPTIATINTELRKIFQ
jgi:hypothetical protein